MTATQKSPEFHRELSGEELDTVAGGATPVAKPAPAPTVYLAINLENIMISH